MLRGTRLIPLALACALVVPAAASAKVWIVKGAGFGHGVGMSQYGAYGYAKHGFAYDQILTHYYTGTTIGTTADQSVRVLLLDGVGGVSFSGASSACGATLKPGKGYVAKRKGGGVVVRSKKRVLVARCGAVMTATGAPNVFVKGKGTYHGSLEVQDLLQRPRRDQRGRARGLRPRRRLEGVAGLMADRGAQGAGRGRAFLRDLDRRPRHLRRLRRYAEPGLRRRGRRDREDRPGSRRDPSAGGPLPRQGRPDLLLLHLRRSHREQRVLLARVRAAADSVPPRCRRPLRGRRGIPRTSTGSGSSPSAG